MTKKNTVNILYSSNFFSYGFRILYSALLLVTPLLMYHKTSELFEFNKMLFIYLITGFVLSLWVYKMIVLKKIIIKKTFLDIPIFLFLASQILSTIFSIDPHTSIYGYYGRFNGGLLSLISYIILYYGFISNYADMVSKRFNISFLLKLSIFASLAVILWGLPGRFNFDLTCLLFTGIPGNGCWTDQFRPSERMFSTLGQPNWLGAYLSIHFFIGFYFLVRYFKKKWPPNLYLCLLILYETLVYISILFTRSRSSIVSVVVGVLALAVYFLFAKGRFDLKGKQWSLGIIIAIIAISSLIFKTGISQVDSIISLSFSPKTSQNSTVSDGKINEKKARGPLISESFDIRRIVWKGAIELGKKYPLFGSGVETFGYSYYFVRDADHNLTSEWDYLYNRAHNEYLNFFATSGFIGLFAYLSFIFAVIFYTFKKLLESLLDGTKPYFLPTLLIISWLTIVITNFFGFSTTVISIFFYIIPVFIVIAFENPIKEYDEDNKPQQINNTQKGLFVIPVIVVIYTIYFVSTYFLADIKYNIGRGLSSMQDYNGASIYLQDALKLKKEHVYEDKLSYVLANLGILTFSESGNIDKGIENNSPSPRVLIDLAKYYSNNSIEKAPSNVLYYKTASKVYYLAYQISKDPKDFQYVLRSLNKASILAPTDPKIPYSKALFYSLGANDGKNGAKSKKYKQRALEEAQLAIDLKPNYKEAYVLKASLYKDYKNNDAARDVYNKYLQTVNPADEEIRGEIEAL